MKLFFDGGWRPGTGMETAVVVRGRACIDRDLGEGTSMDAEWLALVRAATLARELGLVDAMLLGDAAAVIAQATGHTRCPRSCVDHLGRFQAVEPLGHLRVRYVKRSQNLAGIALAALHGR